MDVREPPFPVTMKFRGNQPLREVMTETLALCRRLELEGAVEARANIILEELLVNIYEHGNLTPDGVVLLSLGRIANSVHLELTDTGRPFDPRSPHSNVAMAGRGGGAGLKIVRKWANVRSYEAGPPSNRLVLSITPPTAADLQTTLE